MEDVMRIRQINQHQLGDSYGSKTTNCENWQLIVKTVSTSNTIFSHQLKYRNDHETETDLKMDPRPLDATIFDKIQKQIQL